MASLPFWHVLLHLCHHLSLNTVTSVTLAFPHCIAAPTAAFVAVVIEGEAYRPVPPGQPLLLSRLSWHFPMLTFFLAISQSQHGIPCFLRFYSGFLQAFLSAGNVLHTPSTSEFLLIYSDCAQMSPLTGNLTNYVGFLLCSDAHRECSEHSSHWVH